MMTYLDLVNAFILEFGINGGVQLSGIGAASNTKEALRVAGFIADADFEIQTLYSNWKFLWRMYDGVTALNAHSLSVPNKGNDQFLMQDIDRDSLVIRPGTNQASYPQFLEWKDFRHLYYNGVLSTSDTPAYWTQDPVRRLWVSCQWNANNIPYRFECWAMPYRLSSDGDVSPICRYLATNPLNPRIAANPGANAVVQPYGQSRATAIRDQSGRIIIMRAAMIYASVEGAMEIMQGASAEYEDLLLRLASKALPGQESDMSSEASGNNTIETP